MVIDNRGMSHRPSGLPRQVAGTYDGNAPDRWRILDARDGADGRPPTIRGRAVFTRLIVERRA